VKLHYPDTSLPPIFIVDDCEDDVFLLRHRLREGGITNPILTFSSPADALAFLRPVRRRQDLPSIIFTDIRMPVSSGFALISAVRENPEWEGIRLVVVTASNHTIDMERALELGANGYLIKSPPAEILADFVRNGPWLVMPRQAPAAVHQLSTSAPSAA
jgi:CheY-like chemotaxis protein